MTVLLNKKNKATLVAIKSFKSDFRKKRRRLNTATEIASLTEAYNVAETVFLSEKVLYASSYESMKKDIHFIASVGYHSLSSDTSKEYFKQMVTAFYHDIIFIYVLGRVSSTR